MSWFVSHMRKPDVGEGIVSRYVIRPGAWFAYQFTGEARLIRRHRTHR